MRERGVRLAPARRAGGPGAADARRALLAQRVLPTTVAVLLLGWAVTCFVDPAGWGPAGVVPVALAALSPALVLPALALISVSVPLRQWPAAGVAAVAALLPWTFVAGYAVESQPPTKPSVTMRAMLVVGEDGQASAQDIVTTVREQKVDVLVMADLSTELTHDLTVLGLTNTLPTRWLDPPRPTATPAGGGTGGSGMALYSRLAPTSVTELPGTRWPMVRARFTVPGRDPATGRATKAELTLLAAHAVRPSASGLTTWRADLRAIRGAITPTTPTLALTTLNATPWHPAFRSVAGDGVKDAADVLGRGLRPTWPSWFPTGLLPVDHALVAGGVGVDDLRTVPLGGTDHRALVISVRTPTR